MGVQQSDAVIVGRVSAASGQRSHRGVDLPSIAENSDLGNAKINVGFSASVHGSSPEFLVPYHRRSKTDDI